MSSTQSGFLLTRSWRDTPQGIELSLWIATDDGPLQLIIEQQEAVCFIDHQARLELPPGARRRTLPLQTLDGSAVDALYFKSSRDLQLVREGPAPIHESDIKPVDRFLMERFVRAGVEAYGEQQQSAGRKLMRNPRIRAVDVVPGLNTVALDIETRGTSRKLLSIACALMSSPHAATRPSKSGAAEEEVTADAVVFMLGKGETQHRAGYTLHYRKSEAELLAAFLDWIAVTDPDILTGWSVVNFDLDTLEHRARALHLPFRLGRGAEIATVLQPGQSGAPRVARVPGRAVLDGIDLMKASFRVFESYSLENVSNEILGTGKLITPEQDKLAEIHRLFRDDKPRLADYNLRDCTLVNDILEKTSLIDFAVQRARLTGLSIDRFGGATAAFDNLYLPHLHRAGYVAPDIQRREDAPGGPGGHVMESDPGLFSDVLVLDFKSLYPSIIRTFFIDPLGMALGDRPGQDDALGVAATPGVDDGGNSRRSGSDDQTVPGFLGARFAREGHILPAIVDELWLARDAAKAARNNPLSQAIKIIMNSFYGIFGSTGCRFYSERLVSSITRRGHEIITETRARVEAAGHRVIYGDTDSLFVVLNEPDTNEDGRVRNNVAAADSHDDFGTSLAIRGLALVSSLNEYWRTTLQSRHGLESRLELEYETHYERFLMPTVRGMPTGSKKRYAGLKRDACGNPTLVIKGLEAVRSDWTPLARNFQRELFRRVFLDLAWETFVLETVEALRSGKLDAELVYRKRLRRDLSDYQRSVPPHVKAARQLKNPGRWIRYIITRNGPEPASLSRSAPDYEHYVEKQLAPAANGILPFLGTSFEEITDAQLRMF